MELDPMVPVNRKVAPQLQECYCSSCGLIAPSWFHRNFVMYEGGFRCVWCAFPSSLVDFGGKPVGPYRAFTSSG